MANNKKLILTVPAHASFADLAREPSVEGVRVNTTIPVKLSLEDTLTHLLEEASGKDVWIDLKCRQLRITEYNVEILQDKEIHYIDLSHEIKVNTPTEVMLDNGRILGKITDVIKDKRLVIPSSTERREGLPLPGQGEIGIRRGMSVTILDPSLVVKGYLTDRDKEYIEAARKLGIHNYMLSFLERNQDIADVLSLDKEAQIIGKIESPAGMEFVSRVFPKYTNILSRFRDRIHLMAARGDLYIQLPKPHEIIGACKQIIKADSRAIMASRIFESLADPDAMPKSQDFSDVYCAMQMGYRRFMLGDDVCRNKDSVIAAIRIFDLLSEEHNKGK